LVEPVVYCYRRSNDSSAGEHWCKLAAGLVISASSFSSDGKHVVTGLTDNTARVWDLSGPTPVSTVLAGHTGLVNSVSFSPDGKRVVTACHDKTARVWDLSGPTPVSTVLAGSGQ
jgi:WD40 repeat protein